MSLNAIILLAGMSVFSGNGEDPEKTPADHYTVVETRVKKTGKWKTVERYKKVTKANLPKWDKRFKLINL